MCLVDLGFTMDVIHSYIKGQARQHKNCVMGLIHIVFGCLSFGFSGGRFLFAGVFHLLHLRSAEAVENTFYIGAGFSESVRIDLFNGLHVTDEFCRLYPIVEKLFACLLENLCA